jgi:hypothetical protein
LDEKKSKSAVLAQERGLDQQFEVAGKECTYREECNKYDPTAARVYDWPITMIGQGGLQLVFSPHICCFMGEVAKKK